MRFVFDPQRPPSALRQPFIASARASWHLAAQNGEVSGSSRSNLASELLTEENACSCASGDRTVHLGIHSPQISASVPISQIQYPLEEDTPSDDRDNAVRRRLDNN